MTASNLQLQSETVTALPSMTAQPFTQRGSVARWFVVDGKLVCKWFPVAG